MAAYLATRLLAVAAISAILAPSALAQVPYSEMNCDELWVERNAIYQYKGYCFKTAKAIAQFGTNCFAPYGKLTKSEAKQVKEIKGWERRRGCSGG